MDFSGVRVWDIAALLWLVVGLDHYRRHLGISFKLSLPEGRTGMSADDREAFDRSADYLRRWRFDRALRNIDVDVSRLLVREQENISIHRSRVASTSLAGSLMTLVCCKLLYQGASARFETSRTLLLLAPRPSLQRKSHSASGSFNPNGSGMY